MELHADSISIIRNSDRILMENGYTDDREVRLKRYISSALRDHTVERLYCEYADAHKPADECLAYYTYGLDMAGIRWAFSQRELPNMSTYLDEVIAFTNEERAKALAPYAREHKIQLAPPMDYEELFT